METNLQKYVNKIKELNPHWKTKSRIVGEAVELWAEENLTCPKCHSKTIENKSLQKLTANYKSVDLICNCCSAKIQIKAKKNSFVTKNNTIKKITGAEYNTTIQSVLSQSPHFYLISYKENPYEVTEIKVVNSGVIKKENIIPRKPLETGKRKGWQGCYIQLDKEQVYNKKFYKQIDMWKQ